MLVGERVRLLIAMYSTVRSIVLVTNTIVTDLSSNFPVCSLIALFRLVSACLFDDTKDLQRRKKNERM